MYSRLAAEFHPERREGEEERYSEGGSEDYQLSSGFKF